MRLVLAALLTLATLSAHAQDRRVWTPAPVPGVSSGNVTPADRAGRSTGPDNSSPFSGLPSGSTTAGQGDPTTRDAGQSGAPSVSR